MLVLPACAGLLALTSPLHAKPVPENLGYGLDKLVASRLAVTQLNAKGGQPDSAFTVNGVAYADADSAALASRAILNADGRVLVDVTLSGLQSLKEVRRAALAAAPSLTISAVDKEYRSVGIIEGYVSVDEAAALANVKGVQAVILALKPDLDRVLKVDSRDQKAAGKPVVGPLPEVTVGQVLTKIGTAFDQGVTQHGVDKINKIYNPNVTGTIDGSGISIGAMSDSFDTRAAAPHAADNVASFDLPGAATNPYNTTPVNVLVDDPAAGTDEGRGMVQIIHKMAPRAKLAYADGVDGEVAFANYIRAMANIPGYENTFPNSNGVPFKGFKANVICDDISYGGEPFYGESIIGNGIDDATAAGVSYFSSAGNNIGINAYESALRVVANGTGLTAAAGNTALANTNINLANVPTNLYAGGFHNFNPAGLDVAARWNIPAATTANTEMQWDDPYDIRVPNLIQPPVFSGTGTTNGTFTVPLTQGLAYVIQETATSGNFDGIVTITDPSGNVVVTQDTGTDEVITFFAPASGNFTVTVAPYSTTTGNFTLVVNRTDATLLLTTDLNLLVFDPNGNYLATKSLTTNNFANNRPVELGTVNAGTGNTQAQFVIARSSTPATGVRLPTRVRVSTRGNGAGGIGPDEYFTYNAVTTKGHATAKGCNGTAAYSVFRPSLPEISTSPGPAFIFFDKNANLLATPEVRLSPTVAAADGANDSDFATDSANDTDTQPNFFGTSAAAPHAAAIAGLVLQAKGGPGSVTPAQMRSILQRSAFPHDLDPSFASASARTSDGGKVVISINSDGYNGTNVSTAQNDPNSFQVSYVGPGSLATLVFNPGGTGATGGAVSGGINGVYDTNATPTSPTVTYFETLQPGLVFEPVTKAFTLGTSTGLVAADVVATPSAQAGSPSSTGNGFYTLGLSFPTAAFTGGKVLRFTIGRGLQRSANTGNNLGNAFTVGTTTVNSIADLFGGGVILPQGTQGTGMTFSGTTTGGGSFSGTIRNVIGAGYSPVDGYGFIDAATAVTLPIQ